MALIEASHLAKTYTTGGVETHALQNASFVVEKGEFIAIMGPSGSGKSTLLHILGFLDKHSGGTYLFQGKSVEEYTEEEMAMLRNKKMGFVFQAFNLLGKTSVLENVMLPLRYSSLPAIVWPEKAAAAVEAVGLTHRSHHAPSELSGGEKQRVAIARALVNDPEIIFADEPTGNLDSRSGKEIMEIIQNLNERGHTIMLITHEKYTAESAKRILLLHDGELVSDEKVAKQNLAKDKFVK